MGYGDQLMATGMARGAKARGKRIAFGDGRKIIWDSRSEEIFRGNPNIARPGSERDADLEWVGYFKGRRIYNHQDMAGDRWVWNLRFRAAPGEVYFERRELANAEMAGRDFVLIEPNVETWKGSAPNKDWGRDRYQAVADALSQAGFEVVQLAYPKAAAALEGARRVRTRTFREALAIQRQAALWIGPEGGMHHGAAAVGTPAVVIFGGFIPPAVTGYEAHTNLTGGATACGALHACDHCRAALDAIGVDQVVAAALEKL
jgi:ADP-heptose:LPS heptosyltransferase